MSENGLFGVRGVLDVRGRMSELRPADEQPLTSHQRPDQLLRLSKSSRSRLSMKSLKADILSSSSGVDLHALQAVGRLAVLVQQDAGLVQHLLVGEDRHLTRTARAIASLGRESISIGPPFHSRTMRA